MSNRLPGPGRCEEQWKLCPAQGTESRPLGKLVRSVVSVAVHFMHSLQKKYGQILLGWNFFLLERPNLFAIGNNTFNKWWHVEEYSVALLC
jgi:hypothetical protein